MVAHGAHACVGTESVERQCVLKAARKKERARSATTSTKRVFIQLLCLLAVSCSMGMCVLSGGLLRYDCAVGSTSKRFRLAVKHTRVKSKYTASRYTTSRDVFQLTCSGGGAGRALEPRAAHVQHVRFRAAQVQHVLGRGGAAFRGLRGCLWSLCACNEIRSWAMLGKNRSRNRTTKVPAPGSSTRHSAPLRACARERHAQTHLKLCQAREVDKALAKRHKALKIKYTNLLGIVQKEVARRQSLGEAVHADLAASQPMLDEPADDAAGVCPAVEEDAGAVESAAAEAAAALEAAAGEALAAAEAVLAELPEQEHDATYDATAAAASHAGGRKPKGAKASSRPPRPPPRRPLPPRSMRPRSMPPPPPSDQLECGQLPVHTCRACEAWFAATGIATKCEHALQPMGRHRLHAAPATPDSFWAMSFTDGDGVRSAVEEVESHAANPFVERVAIDESCFAGVNGQRSGGRRSF
jgi:hypothetical protein